MNAFWILSNVSSFLKKHRECYEGPTLFWVVLTCLPIIAELLQRVQSKDQGYLLKGSTGLKDLWKSCSRYYCAGSHSMLQCHTLQSFLMLLLMALSFTSQADSSFSLLQVPAIAHKNIYTLCPCILPDNCFMGYVLSLKGEVEKCDLHWGWGYQGAQSPCGSLNFLPTSLLYWK